MAGILRSRQLSIFVICSAFQQARVGVTVRWQYWKHSMHNAQPVANDFQQVSDRWRWQFISIITTMHSNWDSYVIHIEQMAIVIRNNPNYNNAGMWIYSECVDLFAFFGGPMPPKINKLRKKKQLREPRPTYRHTSHTPAVRCQFAVNRVTFNLSFRRIKIHLFTHHLHSVNSCNRPSVCKIERNLFDFCRCTSGSYSGLNSHIPSTNHSHEDTGRVLLTEQMLTIVNRHYS